MKVITALLLVLHFVLSLRTSAQDLIGQAWSAEGAVPYVSVVLEGTNSGAVGDANGRFHLMNVTAGTHRLLITCVGYRPYEHSFTMPSGLLDLGRIMLVRTQDELDEVVVTGTLKEVSRTESTVPVEVITAKLFRKNPVPTLFEAIGMVNGVRPQLNCNVCNTGDIHINGMEGPYTMVLIDGMPIVSSLSTVYGLSGIPSSLVERVEVVKGPASSLYGSEAMGGIINVITKDPALAPKVAVDVFGTTWGELNVDAGVTLRKGNVFNLIGLNYFRYQDPRDENDDGFTDVTLQDRISIFNKISVRRPDRKQADLALRYVSEDRWGGQMAWTPKFRGDDSLYGESIYTRRLEVIGRYQLPLVKGVHTQLSYNWHDHDSRYGTTSYIADQQVAFGQIYWDGKFGSRNSALAGLSLRYTHYDDNTPATASADLVPVNRPQRTPLPGIFVQNEWSITDVQKLLIGFRVDQDMNHGTIPSPRLAYKLAPNGRNVFRASFGTGFRVVNLFTEDHAALTGARQVVIAEDLLPERSVNGIINWTRKFPGADRSFGLDLSVFCTYFSNQITGNYDIDPDKIIYANLNGYAVSQGASLNLEGRFGQWFRGFAGVSYLDVFRMAEEGTGTLIRRDQIHAPDWSGTFTGSFTLPEQITIDLTVQWNGPMRLPTQPSDFRPEYSPWFAILNIQVTKKFAHGVELYAGVKNLLDFTPRDPLMRPFDPFDKQAGDALSNPNGYTFDTEYNYAPLQGIRGFFGLRWTIL